MQIAIAQVPLLTQEQISEETLQINRWIVNTLHRTLVVGPYQCIAEVPGVLGKEVIIYIEAQRTQILYGKDSGREFLGNWTYRPERAYIC